MRRGNLRRRRGLVLAASEDAPAPGRQNRGGTRVVPRGLHHLLDPLRDLGVGKHLGRHRIKRERTHHQWRHPPCVVGPDDVLPLQATLLEDVDGGDVVLDLLLVLLQNAPLPP